jgi:hypothetical protein
MIERVEMSLVLFSAFVSLEYDWRLSLLLFMSVFAQLIFNIIADYKKSMKKNKTEDEIIEDFINAVETYKQTAKELPLKVNVSFNLLDLVTRNKATEDKIYVNEMEDIFISQVRLALNLNLTDYDYVIVPRGKKC